jgi:hypothetical protein
VESTLAILKVSTNVYTTINDLDAILNQEPIVSSPIQPLLGADISESGTDLVVTEKVGHLHQYRPQTSYS